MRVSLIAPSIFAAKAASGQAAFVPQSHAFAVKLKHKRADSKPVNSSGESTIACETPLFGLLYKFRVTADTHPNVANVAGAIALHCHAGTSSA
jgi:hypothetical protein